MMGLFDSVYAECVGCGKPIEFQSKADCDPYMNSFTAENAPTHILTDVLNDPKYCQHCGTWNALVDRHFPPAREAPRPAPQMVRVRNPTEGEFSTHPQGMRWWDAPFTFADVPAMSAGTAETVQPAQGQSPASAVPERQAPEHDRTPQTKESDNG